MPDTFNPSRPPGLLLATDLGPRSDRSLERSKQLAQEFALPIEVLTLVEAPHKQADVLAWFEGDAGRERQAGAARLEFALEFDGAGLQAAQRFAAGQVDDAILDAASALPGWLVVTGSAREYTLGRLILGSTVERLARGLLQPLLVVRRRVRGPYRSILVAVDGSDAARDALQLAAGLFPARRIVAYGAASDGQAGLERFIDSCGLDAAVRANIAVLAFEGDPDTLPVTQLTDVARTNAVDLAVLGLQAEPALARLLACSRNEQLLQGFACDTLLVPA
jgi:nucleotide-binding universal stress UspA family protein